MIIFHLSKLRKARFFILCDVIFLVRLLGKFEIDHSLRVKGLNNTMEDSTIHNRTFWKFFLWVRSQNKSNLIKLKKTNNNKKRKQFQYHTFHCRTKRDICPKRCRSQNHANLPVVAGKFLTSTHTNPAQPMKKEEPSPHASEHHGQHWRVKTGNDSRRHKPANKASWECEIG